KRVILSAKGSPAQACAALDPRPRSAIGTAVFGAMGAVLPSGRRGPSRPGFATDAIIAVA
ncbi:MAG: hypothetical protein DWQ08_10390, partial [Proteobacteria bacterium]